MFNQLLALFLLGTIAWGLVQWARTKRWSYLATSGTSSVLLVALATRHPLAYFGAMAMILLRWSLIAKERGLGSLAKGDSVLPKLGVRPSEPGNPLGLDLAPARLPGESTQAMIERHVASVRASEELDDQLTPQMSAYRAMQALDTEALRPVFQLVNDRAGTVRTLAADTILDKGDDLAIAVLRQASERYADLRKHVPRAVCARGSDALHAEKEAYFTHQDRVIRREALMELAAALLKSEAGSREAKLRLERVLLALAAETDDDLVRELVDRLTEGGYLNAVTAAFQELPPRHRRVIADHLPKEGQKSSPLAVSDLLRTALHDADPAVVGAARASIRRSGLEALRDELEQPATALEGWTELTLETTAANVPCEGGTLAIEPGELRARARFEHRRQAEIDTVRLKVVLADSEGREWGLESYFQGSMFTDDFVDDDRRLKLEAQSAFVFWSDAPESWETAMKERCLVAGAGELLDDRFYFDLHIGSNTVTLQMKYQGPKIDVAVLGSQLVVRVSELRQILFTGEGAERELDSVEPLPPFAWLAPAERLLCFSEPQRHYSSLEELDEVDPEDAAPVEAKRLDRKGEPQLGVVFDEG